MKIRFFFIYILALILVTVVTIFLMLSMARTAHAGEVVYYCKGITPFVIGLQDFKVWIERSCQWLPVILR